MSNIFDQDFEPRPPIVVVPPPPPRGSGNVFDADFGPQVPQPPQGTPNKVFGELKPTEYSWRQTLSNKAQDALMALGMKPYDAGKFGRGAVDAASLFPPVGVPLSGADAMYYGQRGQLMRAGAETLGALPAAPLIRNIRAGGIRAGQPDLPIAPSEATLDATRNAQYKAWRGSPVVRDPAMMDDLTNEIARTLTQQGSNPTKASRAWRGLEEGRNLKRQTGMTNEDFETLRQQFDLKNVIDSDEIIGASRARTAFDRYMENPPSQFVRHGTPAQVAVDQANLLNARGNTAALKRSKTVTDPINAAELRAETGKDFGKTLERKIDALATTKGGERSTRGFTAAEKEMVRDTITDPNTRRMYGLADWMQGTGAKNPLVGGALSSLPGASVGAAAWKAAGLDPTTAAIAAAMTQVGQYAGGSAIRSAAGRRIASGVEDAAARLRLRSPVAQQNPAYGLVVDPNVLAKDASIYFGAPIARERATDWAEQDRAPYQYR